MNTLKPNQIVEVYLDPIIRKGFEGHACLVEQIREDLGDGLSIWIVEFLDERGAFYTRTISAGEMPTACVCLKYIGDNGFCPVHGVPKGNLW